MWTELDPAFSIGWFSYYMLWLGFVLLVPSSWLRLGLLPFAWVKVRISRSFPATWGASAASAMVASALLAVVAFEADLPGVREALLGTWLFLFSGLLGGKKILRASALLRAALSVGAGSLALFGCLTVGEVRFDYYRRLAGELSRMGRTRAALEQYRHAQRYAPVGASRQAQIRMLERELSRSK